MLLFAIISLCFILSKTSRRQLGQNVLLAVKAGNNELKQFCNMTKLDFLMKLGRRFKQSDWKSHSKDVSWVTVHCKSSPNYRFLQSTHCLCWSTYAERPLTNMRKTRRKTTHLQGDLKSNSEPDCCAKTCPTLQPLTTTHKNCSYQTKITRENTK